MRSREYRAQLRLQIIENAIRDWLWLNVRKGSLAELNDTPKAAARAAGIEGIADLAIRRKRPFVRISCGEYWPVLFACPASLATIIALIAFHPTPSFRRIRTDSRYLEIANFDTHKLSLMWRQLMRQLTPTIPVEVGRSQQSTNGPFWISGCLCVVYHSTGFSRTLASRAQSARVTVSCLPLTDVWSAQF